MPVTYDQTKEVVVLKVQPLANIAKKTALRYDVTHFIIKIYLSNFFLIHDFRLAIAVSIIVGAFTVSVILYSLIYYFTIPVSVQQ